MGGEAATLQVYKGQAQDRRPVSRPQVGTRILTGGTSDSHTLRSSRDSTLRSTRCSMGCFASVESHLASAGFGRSSHPQCSRASRCDQTPHSTRSASPPTRSASHPTRSGLAPRLRRKVAQVEDEAHQVQAGIVLQLRRMLRSSRGNTGRRNS